MARDYALEYERRRIRAQARGFRSPAEETRYKKAAKTAAAQGKKKLTVYNYRQQTIAEAKRRKIAKARTLTKAKQVGLKAFGITAKQFELMRKQNRAFDKKNKSPRLRYNLKLDREITNLSEERIGYIVGYNTVFVNPKTKQYTGKRREQIVNKYFDLIEKYDLFADQQDLLDYAYVKESRAA